MTENITAGLAGHLIFVDEVSPHLSPWLGVVCVNHTAVDFVNFIHLAFPPADGHAGRRAGRGLAVGTLLHPAGHAGSG